MQVRKLFYAFLALFLIGIGITVAGDGVQRKYLPSEKEFYLNEAEVAWLRPGLKLTIQSVAVSGSDVSVTYRIADDQDQPLDRLGIEQPGTVSTSWLLARIKSGDTQYTSYATRTQTSPITGVSAIQAATDSGGTYTPLGNGIYKYTFGTKLPSGYEADATHTVGVYATRDVRALAEQLGLTKLATTGRYISNATSNFVPSGKAVTQVRDIVRTEACNQCHDPLALHGGSRQKTEVCILCHQPQTTDPDTGNTVDFKVMIHKIHQGAFLPSVMGKRMNLLSTSGSNTSATPATTATGSMPAPRPEGDVPAGKPYKIIGFNQTVLDFSTVVWPQDVRNCTTCHQQGTQSDNWKKNPTRVACGSCHDDVDFATGKNHAGGVQVDDSKCSICHQADTGLEFDLSVAGVHTIPIKSKQLAGLNLTITGVTNTKPGDKPTVSFKATDGKGNPVDPTKLNTLAFILAGPNTDYTFATRSATSGFPSTENALTAAKPSGSEYTYTFTTALPADAKGTYTVGGQGYRLLTIPGSLTGQSFAIRESATNALFDFGVGGATATPRRKVVDVKNCNVCHQRLAIHGGTRTNTEYCVLCHMPKAATPEGMPINFRTHIHRLHTGEELENEWDVGRNYNGLLFPGDRRNCSKCHAGTSYQLPLPAGMATTDSPGLFYTPLGPAASACLGCHDSQDAAAHAFLMTAPTIGESCAACHGEGKEFSVSRVHAR